MEFILSSVSPDRY